MLPLSKVRLSQPIFTKAKIIQQLFVTNWYRELN